MPRIFRILKATVKLIGETSLMSIVGAIVLILTGNSVVETRLDGTWQYASPGATFFLHFRNIAMLYLLYRAVQWAIKAITRKTTKAVDSSLQDNTRYTGIRDRVRNAFSGQATPPPTPAPAPEPTPTPTPQPDLGIPEPAERCPSCGVLLGRVHLSNCATNQ